jgi:hypothetical protein
MSSTTNVQSYLPYAFRPVYTWNSATGVFSTTFNLSNIDSISVNTATIGLMNVGDSNLNVYVGNTAGNIPSNATSAITYYNTALGNAAGAGISNTSNSVFIGYLAGNAGNSIYNSLAIGGSAGSNASNVTNCVWVGTSNSVGLSNVSNTVSIGGSSGGGSGGVFLGASTGVSASGASNIVMGASSGGRLTGSNNVFIGHSLSPTISNTITATVLSNIVTCTTPTATGLVAGQAVLIAGLVPSGFNGTTTILTVPTSNTFTYSNTTGTITSGTGTVTAGISPYIAPYTGTSTAIASNVSNKLFIGSSSNVLIAGDFSTGLTTIGTANTTGSSFSGLTPANPLMTLDVARYSRFQLGIGIGIDPGTYALDVNGQFRVTDGYGQIAMSNQFDGAGNSSGPSNASFVEMKPVSGGTMTLAVTGNTKSSGYYTFQGTTAAFGNGTTSNVATLTTTGMVNVTVRNATGVMYSAPFLVSNATTGTFTSASTPLSNAALTYAVNISNGGVILSNTSAGSVTFTYNVMFYPC